MVGTKIKRYLSENGIKQTWLAERTGIPVPSLSNALNGTRRLTLAEYELIIGALRLPAGTFLEAKAHGEA